MLSGPWQPVFFYGLFGLLCAFTLTTADGGNTLCYLLCSMALSLLAGRLIIHPAKHVAFNLPSICLLFMAGYSLLQTAFFRHRITSNGLTATIFWLTAAALTLLAFDLFKNERQASRFRLFFIVFGSAMCILDLLEQASGTNRYFWLFPSRFPVIFGTFAYWNNFAQFVELLLPVTLWQGLVRSRSAAPYLLCAAVQVSSVVASGSRAGTFLVFAELLAIILLAYGQQHRSKTLLLGGAAAVALSALFVYAAGFETVIAKLQQSDQLSVRRNIDRSSLAMILSRPLTGWGLDTYVPVYRMFARYDDGTFVNRAHNDWLQWAAEGGIFFPGAMLIVVLWSIKPAVRSGWGLGLVAICIHALVDYPFARFGVCAWYFCLLGMLSSTNPSGNPPRPLRSRSAETAVGLRSAYSRL